ncbi:MAG: thioredoxin family protein [Xanthomonadaceae bacterium]|jgi:thioredoxin-related protein|nr:thioredoxin family protein [Xanthomonadaceae bacterium]
MRIRFLFAAVALAVSVGACQPSPEPQPVDTTPQKPAVADPSQPVVSGNTPAAADIAAIAALNAEFDPARDPAKDLQTAIVEAKRNDKRIVLDIGGEWCPWCHILDQFIAGDAEVRRLRDANFVWMKVNYSEENENKAFLSQYPGVKGYPHLFVLDGDGNLLHSQFTGELEEGKGYNREKFLAFLNAWAPETPKLDAAE